MTRRLLIPHSLLLTTCLVLLLTHSSLITHLISLALLRHPGDIHQMVWRTKHGEVASSLMNHDSLLMTQTATAASDPDDPAAAMAMAQWPWQRSALLSSLPPSLYDSSLKKQTTREKQTRKITEQ
jgi:hypothetical protein